MRHQQQNHEAMREDEQIPQDPPCDILRNIWDFMSCVSMENVPPVGSEECVLTCGGCWIYTLTKACCWDNFYIVNYNAR